MEAHAIIRLRFPSQKNLQTALNALKPETRTPATSRCKVQVNGKNNQLTLNFEARDTSALRASINSYLRTTIMAIEVLGLMEELDK